MVDVNVNDFDYTEDPTDKTVYMVTGSSDYQTTFTDFMKGLIRSNGLVSVGVGTNVVNFSTPFNSTDYSLIIYDANGIGVEVASKTVTGFTLDSLGAGDIGYIAIKNI